MQIDFIKTLLFTVVDENQYWFKDIINKLD